jgi:type VI secretion system protein
MPLRLTMTPTGGHGERQTRTLAQGSLSIGRAGGNDWVLADPDQHLSRTHCMVGFEGGQYWITDLSTNGMLINGAREPTTRDSRIVLTDGDTVQLGGYLLEVAQTEERGAAASSPFGGGSFVTPRADPFGGGGREASGREGSGPLDIDPLDDPLGRPDSGGFQHPMAHPPPSMRAEDPFDAVEKNRQGRADDDLFRGEAPLDQWSGPAQPDRADVVSHAYSAPRPIAPAAPVNLDDIDFDALLGDVMPSANAHPLAAPPSPPPRAAPPGMDALDDLLGDFPLHAPPPAPAPPATAPQAAMPVDPFADPPVAPAAGQVQPVAAAPPEQQPAAVPPAPMAAAPPAALLAAFLDGAGLPQLDLSGADQEATMRAIGALFRALVGGTREVLMSRAEIKHEMRVEQTMIRSRDNNALKFSVSPEEALVALLRPNQPGYKPPLASVEEAFSDIRSHEMAVMAGMQTGLIALLKRFDPAGLEARLQRGMLDGILPGARKARFWELFCTTYKDIAHEAEDDFHAVFGRDFARAYSAQISKL